MIDEQPGNFRNSIRVNDELTTKLDWNPKDRLENYVNNLI